MYTIQSDIENTMTIKYNARKMEDLLRSFYQLTKLRIVVFSDTFIKIAEAPGHDCVFCQLIRSDKAAVEVCRTSDRLACKKCRTENSLYSYTCHAGLTETVAPIRYNNIVIGYLMFGQVLLQPEPVKYWEIVKERCSHYNVDMEALFTAYKRIKTVDMGRVYAAAKVMEACAGYLWLDRMISLDGGSLPGLIDDFITQNIDADLSVESLCNHFNISRSKLYQIMSEYYGCGLEKMTRMLRVAKSKELLEATSASIAEIALQVGYADYNYFIKVFKKETGTTPLQYRKVYLLNTKPSSGIKHR
jgi:AraC-like DNA-binding protein/ligand-binding sensor protein